MRSLDHRYVITENFLERMLDISTGRGFLIFSSSPFVLKYYSLCPNITSSNTHPHSIGTKTPRTYISYSDSQSTADSLSAASSAHLTPTLILRSSSACLLLP